MNEEEKGFVIKDRRSFDEKGELKDIEPKIDEKAESEKKEAEPKKEAPKEEAERSPLPEVNFSTLIFSLSSSALFHLGEIADPQTGEKKKELPLAKHAIDTIVMLREKTKGNLTEEEQKFVDSVLNDLQWRYVKAAE
jgi:DNA replication initiation complex subunit (GINS family)